MDPIANCEVGATADAMQQIHELNEERAQLLQRLVRTLARQRFYEAQKVKIMEDKEAAMEELRQTEEMLRVEGEKLKEMLRATEEGEELLRVKENAGMWASVEDIVDKETVEEDRAMWHVCLSCNTRLAHISLVVRFNRRPRMNSRCSTGPQVELHTCSPHCQTVKV